MTILYSRRCSRLREDNAWKQLGPKPNAVKEPSSIGRLRDSGHRITGGGPG